MAFNMDDYIDVAARLTELKATHPEARMQPADPTKPYSVETIETVTDKGLAERRTFIVYTAACYRDADDTLPGIGCAWEPFPGTTNYTRNSELQNAETSAWGRAIVAALLGDTKKSVASAQEVRNRSAENERKADRTRAPKGATAVADPADPFNDQPAQPKVFDVEKWQRQLDSADSEIHLTKCALDAAQAHRLGLVDAELFRELVESGNLRRKQLGLVKT